MGYDPDISALTSLIRCLAINGDLEGAFNLLEEIRSRILTTNNLTPS
jgi:pentatricopeptide repeat protein